METNLNSSNKISKEKFFEILNDHDSQSERIDYLIKAGLHIWDSELVEYGNIMFDRVIESYFNSEGVDWIFWWLYEKDGNPDIKAWDEDQNEIPMETKEDLWKYIEQYRK